MGMKQKPWWPFLKFEHLMVPLLHCMIEVGNNLLNKFCDGVNEFIDNKSIQQINIKRALTNYELIVLETVKQRDDFDCLKGRSSSHCKQRMQYASARGRIEFGSSNS